MTVEIAITEIRPNPANTRKYSTNQIRQITNLVDVPVILITGLSPAKRRALAIAAFTCTSLR